MSEYILSIIGVAVLVGVVDILTPENASLSKYSRLIAGLVVAVMLLSPLRGFVSYLSGSFWGELEGAVSREEESEKYEDILIGGLESATRKNVEDGVLEILSESFNIKEENASVHVKLVRLEEALHVENLTICLSGTAIFANTYEIEEYFTSLLGCECVTVIE